MTETIHHHPVIDAGHLAHQRDWSLDTFGHGPRTLGVIDHCARVCQRAAVMDTP